MPLQCAWEHRPVGRNRLIDALEQRCTEHTSINDRPCQTQALQGRAIEHAAPLAMSTAVELVGMLEAQQGFGLAVARLLAQVGSWILSAMVPDERPRRESDP